MDLQERGVLDALRKQVAELRRANTRLRAVALHDCGICRCCIERERLVDQALGRQRQTMQIPFSERLPDART